MSTGATLRLFRDSVAMATAVSADLAACLSETISRCGTAVFAAAGGRSPVTTYDRLSQTEIPWEHVIVTLTDERCVPPESPESNERMLRRHLLCGRATSATFLSPVYLSSGASNTLHANIRMPIDVVLLGMGGDGHVASLFRTKDIDTASGRSSPWLQVPAGQCRLPPKEPRVSLTLDALLSARRVLLIASGSVKKQLIDQAIHGSTSDLLPIHMLVRLRSDLQINWSP